VPDPGAERGRPAPLGGAARSDPGVLPVQKERSVTSATTTKTLSPGRKLIRFDPIVAELTATRIEARSSAIAGFGGRFSRRSTNTR
jgi:hypothetical protein